MANGIDDYITDDPSLADYAIEKYKVLPDSDVIESGNYLLWTENLFEAPANVEYWERFLYTNIDIAFTELDRMTDYGELDNPEVLLVLTQAYNSDNPKVIRFWKNNKLYINGIDFTLNPQGHPIPRSY
jgi:hypothetical protein